jgi:hypothetical protein
MISVMFTASAAIASANAKFSSFMSPSFYLQSAFNLFAMSEIR